MQLAYYPIFKILVQYFLSAIKKQKVKKDGKLELKYKKLPMPLKEFQYNAQKTDQLPLPILPQDKSSVSETIDILKE